jgi:hypothetical protein
LKAFTLLETGHYHDIYGTDGYDTVLEGERRWMDIRCFGNIDWTRTRMRAKLAYNGVNVWFFLTRLRFLCFAACMELMLLLRFIPRTCTLSPLFSAFNAHQGAGYSFLGFSLKDT